MMACIKEANSRDKPLREQTGTAPVIYITPPILNHPLSVFVSSFDKISLPKIEITMSTAINVPANYGTTSSIERQLTARNMLSSKPTSNLALSALSVPTQQIKRSVPTPSTTGKATARRVNLGPGCSMLDWIRLCKNTKDMAGNGGTPLQVTEEELSKHCTESDAWTCYKGKVYNITWYFKFHPGGKADLLSAAGKDCTILFDEAHSWVNIESMLKRCFVGELVQSSVVRRDSLTIRRDSLRKDSLRKDSLRKDSLNRLRSGSRSELTIPKPTIVIDGMNRHAVAKRESESSDEAVVHTPQSPVNPPIHVNVDETDSAAIVVVPPSPIRKNSDASRPTMPRWDYYQTESTILIHVYTHNKNLKYSDVIVDVVDGLTLEGSIELDNWVYELKIQLLHPIAQLEVSIHTAKVELRLIKSASGQHWPNIGKLLPGNDLMVAKTNKVANYRKCIVKSIKSITHDTNIYTLQLPATSHMVVPVGYHISIKGNDKGEIVRSYTPVQSFGLPSSGPCSTIDLMIKLYEDGAMSRQLSQLNEGDSLMVGDPVGTFEAKRLSGVIQSVLIAAGSGFTPMVGVLNELLYKQPDPSNDHKHRLIFANKTEKDIMWRRELDQLAQSNPNFEVSHILSAPDPSWEGHKGRVTSQFLQNYLPISSSVTPDKLLICVCGPQPFTTGIITMLMELGYPDTSLHIFE